MLGSDFQHSIFYALFPSFMPDKLTPEQRHKCMASIKSRNTRPEVLVRKFLFAHGYRFRINVKRLPGTPDIVLRKYRTCIFVNGCFWNGHEGCKYFVLPKTNTEFRHRKLNGTESAKIRKDTSCKIQTRLLSLQPIKCRCMPSSLHIAL